MTTVYLVQHAYESDAGVEEVKFIGVYSKPERASEAVDRLARQPGFSAHRDGFHIDPYELDRDYWEGGFWRPDA